MMPTISKYAFVPCVSRFSYRIFFLEGEKFNRASMKQVNVGGEVWGHCPLNKFWKFSFSEVDFSAILYTQLCITLVLPCT